MSEETNWLGRRLAVAGATVLAAGALACAVPAQAEQASTDASQAGAEATSQAGQTQETAAATGTSIVDASEVPALSSDSATQAEATKPADAPEGENPRPGMDNAGAPDKKPGASEGEELAAAVKVAPECAAADDGVTLWVWAASMNVDPDITLRQLNAWRAQAASKGVVDADGDAIAGEALAWSDSLAYVAQELAVELALGGGDSSSLERLNGSGSVTAGEGNTFFNSTNITGVSVSNLTSVQGALDAWYVESTAYWAWPTNYATDEYACAVSNDARAVGMAAVMLSNEEVYIVCVYGDASPEQTGDNTYAPTTGSAIYQGVNVRLDYLDLVLEVPQSCTAGQEVALALKASTTLEGNAVGKDNGVAIDSQEIFDEATIQVVQNGQVVGTVEDGILQAQQGFASGEATVQVVLGGQVVASAATQLVSVAENVDASASFDATAQSGASVELPQTASVVWSGGDVTEEPVQWADLTDEQQAVVASREGGSFQVEGTVEATGETVTSTVTVEPATMVSAEAPAVDFVWAGGTPELPQTVAVTWSNGDVTDEAVSWQVPDTAQPGTVEAVGAVEGLGQAITVSFEVKALEVYAVDATGIATAQPVSGQAGDELLASLAQSVPVTWSDGSVTEEAVAWDALTDEQAAVLASREGGAFELSGTVGDTGQTVSAQVEVQAATAVSAEAPAAQEIWVGGTPELPATVAVTWSNGDVTEEAVTWDVPEGAFDQAGTVTLQGAVACMEAPVELAVTVKELEVEGVGEFESPSIDVQSGASAESAVAELPATVAVTWSDGSVTEEAITWDGLTDEQEATLASREGGSVEVTGTVGQTGEQVSSTIDVAPATAEGTAAPEAVQVWEGDEAELPQTVSVTWSNGDVTEEDVTWDDVDTSEAGTHEVEGAVGDTGQIATVTVTVDPIVPIDIEMPETLSLDLGDEAELPKTVSVTWSNGDVTDEAVTWEDADTSEVGTYEVKGTVEGTDATVTAQLEVKADEKAVAGEDAAADEKADAAGSAAAGIADGAADKSSANSGGASGTSASIANAAKSVDTADASDGTSGTEADGPDSAADSTGADAAADSAEEPAAAVSDASGSADTSGASSTPASSTGANASSSTSAADEGASSGLPNWIIVTLGGLGAAAVATIAYIFGKKRSNGEDEDGDDEPRGKHAAK